MALKNGFAAPFLCIVKKGNFKRTTAESEKLKQSRKKNQKQIIMKKLLIIAVASSFIFISCTKDAPTQPAAQSTSGSKSTNVSQVNQNSPIVQSSGDTHCFTITNLETNPGVVEYIVEYVDCNGNVKKVPLPAGQYLSDCIQYGTVTTNFAYGILACR